MNNEIARSQVNTSHPVPFQWYAIHVRSRHEFKVKERLTKAGIETFLPVVERLSRWKDRKKLVNFPLFSGYLFVYIDGGHQNRLTVLKINGVVRFLGAIPGEPEPVPEELITSLKRLLENKTPLDPYPNLAKGHRVRIKGGPLAGIEGILVEKIGQHVLVLSVDVLQQGAALKIEAMEVERV